MQILRSICSYCGNAYRGYDSVNTLKSYCNECSKARIAFAQQAFHGRRVVVVAYGKYVVSKLEKDKITNSRS